MGYILDQAGDPNERERLALLQRYYDPKTIPQLERLGVAPGWYCHDIGAGGGSVAQWLAARVGPNGSVLATDLDTTLLEPLASPILAVRRHDIRHEDLPQGAHLVHARLLLEHLPNPEDVLQRMIRALRPGGWLLLNDLDFRTLHFSDADAAFDRVTQAFAAATHAAGWNIQLGPALPAMLEKAGLTDVAGESWQTYDRSGVLGPLLAMTYRRVRDRMIGQGAIALDVDRVVAKAASAGIYGPSVWMVWGRRPQ